MLQLKSLHGLRNTWETLSGASTNIKLNIHHADRSKRHQETPVQGSFKRHCGQVESLTILCQSWYLCMDNLHIFKGTISA